MHPLIAVCDGVRLSIRDWKATLTLNLTKPNMTDSSLTGASNLPQYQLAVPIHHTGHTEKRRDNRTDDKSVYAS